LRRLIRYQTRLIVRLAGRVGGARAPSFGFASIHPLISIAKMKGRSAARPENGRTYADMRGAMRDGDFEIIRSCPSTGLQAVARADFGQMRKMGGGGVVHGGMHITPASGRSSARA
jgi:hypothetical protein